MQAEISLATMGAHNQYEMTIESDFLKVTNVFPVSEGAPEFDL